MALDRVKHLERTLRSVTRHSDDELFGTIEIKMERGVPVMMRVIQQYKTEELPLATAARLQEVLGGPAGT